MSGMIGLLGLTNWWFSEFTEKERQHIVDIFQPMGGSGNMLTKREYVISTTFQSPMHFLSGLASWFSKPEDRQIAKRILKKAEEFVPQTNNVLDKHFFYYQMIEIYYKDRENPTDFAVAIDSCEKQIALAQQSKMAFLKQYGGQLPSHTGYTQLAIIREKEKNLAEAIKLSETAFKQGWAGDWEKRIVRCNKKLAHAYPRER